MRPGSPASSTQKTQKCGLSALRDRGPGRIAVAVSGRRRRRSAGRAAPAARARSRRSSAGHGGGERRSGRAVASAAGSALAPARVLAGRRVASRRRRATLGRRLADRRCEAAASPAPRCGEAASGRRQAPAADRERLPIRRPAAKSIGSSALNILSPMNEPARGLRVALAQINPTVGDIDGNAALIADWIARAREAGAGPRRLPGALPARLSGRGPLPEAPLRRGERRRARARSPPRRRGIAALVGFAEPRPAPAAGAADGPAARPVHNSLAAARRRRGRGGPPQEPAAQLRRLRRGPLLRARQRADR